VLALAGQSGDVYRFLIAGDNLLEHNAAIEPKSLPPGSQLYFDSWFSSPLLIKSFLGDEHCRNWDNQAEQKGWLLSEEREGAEARRERGI
jgi:hypothetical protein